MDSPEAQQGLINGMGGGGMMGGGGPPQGQPQGSPQGPPPEVMGGAPQGGMV